MTAKLSIALDVMGGDNGPRVVCNAALQELQHNPQLHLILVGNEEVIRPLVDDHARQFGERLIIHHTSQVVAMDEQPTLALRNKKDSSMRVAVNLVNDGQADACVSAGNTGALVATAHYVLKTLPGISRPALIKCLPAIDGRTWVLDLGANIDCSAHQLFQFSVMGSVISEAVGGIQHPRIGLLNMAWEGLENSKKYIEAAQLLFSSELNYIGYIDGGQIYSSDVDVVVSDGFVNNVALKTSEGAAKFILTSMKKEFGRNLATKMAAYLAYPVLKKLRARADARNYNGASLLGLRGIVIKSHGNADSYSFAHAIRHAISETKMNIPYLIGSKIDKVLNGRHRIKVKSY